MGVILKAVNTMVLLFLVLKAIGGPLFDAQIILPQEYYPKFLANIKTWYISEIGDYSVVEKPNFLVALAWFELFVGSPLSIINVCGLISSNKSWFKATCLTHAAILTTSMVAIIGELIGSGKSSNKLLNVYYFFMGLAILVFVRGLFCSSCETLIPSNKSSLADRKKRS